MKKFVLMILIAGSVISAKAQSETFKAFRVGITPGYAHFSGSGATSGYLFDISPKYAINDKISIGLRIEGAGALSTTTVNLGDEDTEFTATGGDAKLRSSYALTGDYYFNTNTFRPFVGIGAGLFGAASASINFEDESEDFGSVSAGYKFGFVPSIGAEYGHFRAAVEYNAVGKTGKEDNSYIGVKVGFFLGGGRK